jgi:hypothetical protein
MKEKNLVPGGAQRRGGNGERSQNTEKQKAAQRLASKQNVPEHFCLSPFWLNAISSRALRQDVACAYVGQLRNPLILKMARFRDFLLLFRGEQRGSKVRHWASRDIVFGDWDAILALKDSRYANRRIEAPITRCI